MFTYTPEDVEPGFASEGLAASVGPEISGRGRIYNIAVSGTVRNQLLPYS